MPVSDSQQCHMLQDRTTNGSEPTVALLVNGKTSIVPVTAESPRSVSTATHNYSSEDTDESSSEEDDAWFADESLDVNELIEAEDAMIDADSASSGVDEEEVEGNQDDDEEIFDGH